MIEHATLLQLAAAVGGGLAGGGGVLMVLWRILDTWLRHRREQRGQSDTVALDLVRAQGVEVIALRSEIGSVRREMEAENRACTAALEAARQEWRAEAAMIDSLIATLKFAAIERHPEVIDDFSRRLDERRARQAVERGDLRNEVQTRVSAARVLGDTLDSRPG